MSFGIDSDILGFADAALGISLQGVESTPKNAQEATAQDSNADVVATTLYDTTYGQPLTHNYVCAKNVEIKFFDTTTSKDFRGGKVINGFVITGASVGTANNQQAATVSFTSQKTISTDSVVAKYDPSITFNGGKGARKFGFTKDTATRLTASGLTFSVEPSRTLDSIGQELALDVGKGRLQSTHTLVGVTGVPGGVADTGWTLLNGPSKSEGNTNYATGTATLFKNISKTE